VDEALYGGGVVLELACIRSAILESDLGSPQGAVIGELHQSAIADGDTEDVRGQVLEGGLSIADRLAVDDPILLPDLWRYLSKGGRLFEEVEEFGTEEFGKGFNWQEEIVVSWQPGLPCLRQCRTVRAANTGGTNGARRQAQVSLVEGFACLGRYRRPGQGNGHVGGKPGCGSRCGARPPCRSDRRRNGDLGLIFVLLLPKPGRGRGRRIFDFGWRPHAILLGG